jgi:ribose transport system substrate-binding protein
MGRLQGLKVGARQRAAALTLVTIAVAVAGCGSTSGSSTTAASSAAGTSSAATSASSAAAGGSQLAAAKTAWQQAQQPVTWNGPTAAAKAKSGMKLVILDCSLSLQGCAVAGTNAQQAAGALGWSSKLIEVADATTYGQKFQTALTQNPNAILTIGFPAAVLPKGPLAQAKAKGIPIVDLNGFCDVGKQGCDASQDYPLPEMGRLQALALMVATNGKLNLLSYIDNELSSGFQNNAATIAYLKAHCSTCKVVQQSNFLTADLASSFPKQVVSDVRTHSSANAILLPYDPVAGLVVPALLNAGLTGKAKVVSNIGLKQNLEWVSQGKGEVADAANALDWGTWAAMDDIVRLLDKQPLVAENVPMKLMTVANAPKSGIWDSDGVDFRSKYKALWGVG